MRVTFREIKRGGREYPGELERIYNPPTLLYATGRRLDNSEPRIGIVGSRRCTAYGRAMAEEMAEELAAQGFTIVSGLARGIDAAAHRGALKSGHTIGVLGCGLDNMYPPENKTLYEQIPEKGTIISEYPPGTPPFRQNFPARNRIISGLSLGVIIVEATVKSGALITADFALEQGKEVMVVPGHAKSPNSEGCHRLLKAGAALVDSAKDVLEVLEFSGFKTESKKEDLTEEEVSLLNLIDYEPTHIDKITGQSPHSVSEIAALLLRLEIKGYLKKEVGGRIIRVK